MAKDESKALDWKEYEAVTKYIYEMLGAQYGIKAIRGYRVQGSSGVKHEVDVLTEQFDGKRIHRTAIECKFIKKKITKEVVMKLRSVMEEAEIDSGIIVCKLGFTKDTMTYAEHKGIRLVELREAVADDLNGEHLINLGVLNIHIPAIMTSPVITMIDFGGTVLTDEREIMAMHYATMRDLAGREVPFRDYTKAFSNELHDQERLLKNITKSFTPLQGKLTWKYRDNELAIEKITFTGFLKETDVSSSSSFQLVDQVWMIMKELFDKKAFKLTKSGILVGI